MKKPKTDGESKYFKSTSKSPAKFKEAPVKAPAKSPTKKVKSEPIDVDSDSEDDFKPDGDDDDDDFDDDIYEIKDEDDDLQEINDEDDDLEVVEVTPKKRRAPPASPKRQPPAKKPVAKAETPRKPVATKKSAASPKKPAKTEEQAPVEAEGESLDQILARIPDAQLPDDEEGVNFRDLMTRKAAADQSTGETVELPEAKPFCLGGLTIVFTGILPRLDRTASENLAKRYGAKVTKSILGKTNLVVIGNEAGPSKVKKIKSLKIKAIDEDGFIQLIQSMPADGGSSKSALAAKHKREEEDRKVIEDAEAEEREEKQKEEEAERQRQKLEKEKLKREQDSKKSGTRLPPETPRVIPNEEKLWTVKYAPTNVTQLCGNKGQINKLRTWLTNWFDNAKKQFKNPGPDGSGVFRAVLISGPPGIGKTTAAHLIAEDLGFDVLEKNASDVRSKSLLNSNIKSVLNNTSVVGFFKHQNDKEHSTKNDRKFCLIMDEVDGMSSGDHGGAGALSAFCKITSMPLILICNDKSLPKMRTFDRVTYDLPFRRPSEVEVRSRLMTIALREHIKLDPTVIGQLVQTTHNDIRQIINLLATVSKTQKAIGHAQSQDIMKSWQKHTVLKPFDITGKLLNGQLFSPAAKVSMNDKINLYFNDIDFTPLMIQENYLFTKPSNVTSVKQHLERVAQAADDISLSDSVNSLIRSSEQQWSLLPFHAVMSSVKPALEVAGSMSQRINFAGWLGQNSKAMKYQRLLQELQYHTRLRTSTDKVELRLDYIPVLVKKLTNPLLQDQELGIEEVIKIMDYYFLSKEDWDALLEFGIGSCKGELITKKLATKTKSAFTRKYNSTSHPVAIYKTGNSVGKRQEKAKVDFDDVIEDDTNVDDKDEEEKDTDKIDPKNDKLIKVKLKKTAKKPKKK